MEHGQRWGIISSVILQGKGKGHGSKAMKHMKIIENETQGLMGHNTNAAMRLVQDTTDLMLDRKRAQ